MIVEQHDEWAAAERRYLSETSIARLRQSEPPALPTPDMAGSPRRRPTVPRECRVEDGWVCQPGRFDGITAATLLLAGSESLPALIKATHEAAAAISDAQIRVLEGHAHFAHKTDPAMVAAIVRKFISSRLGVAG